MNDRMTKNYSTDGGDTLVIGGKLVIEEGATVEGLPLGDGITPAANQPDSDATELADLVTAFNGLLTKLKAVGLMAADE